MKEDIEILKSKDADLKHVLFVEKAAFDTNSEANLSASLIKDPTAQPVISLLAFDGKKPVGHILFSKASVEGYHRNDYVYLLAPLAVLPEYRDKGIGGELISTGLKKLKEMGVEMVFVYGPPDYYKKHGFVPDASSFGFAPPNSIPSASKEGWMVQTLTIKGLSASSGRVVCADALNKPEFWKE